MTATTSRYLLGIRHFFPLDSQHEPLEYEVTEHLLVHGAPDMHAAIEQFHARRSELYPDANMVVDLHDHRPVHDDEVLPPHTCMTYRDPPEAITK